MAQQLGLLGGGIPGREARGWGKRCRGVEVRGHDLHGWQAGLQHYKLWRAGKGLDMDGAYILRHTLATCTCMGLCICQAHKHAHADTLRAWHAARIGTKLSAPGNLHVSRTHRHRQDASHNPPGEIQDAQRNPPGKSGMLSANMAQ